MPPDRSAITRIVLHMRVLHRMALRVVVVWSVYLNFGQRQLPYRRRVKFWDNHWRTTKNWAAVVSIPQFCSVYLPRAFRAPNPSTPSPAGSLNARWTAFVTTTTYVTELPYHPTWWAAWRVNSCLPLALRAWAKRQAPSPYSPSLPFGGLLVQLGLLVKKDGSASSLWWWPGSAAFLPPSYPIPSDIFIAGHSIFPPTLWPPSETVPFHHPGQDMAWWWWQ